MRALRYVLLGLGVLMLLGVSVALVLRDLPAGRERVPQRTDLAKEAPQPAPAPGGIPAGKTETLFAPPPEPPRVAPSAPDMTSPAAPPLAKLNLTAAQQEKVRDILLTHSIMQAAAPDFPLRQGASVPETVPLLPLPHELAGEVPNFQRYSYVIAQDRIVIVVTDRREIGFLISI